MKTSHVLLYAGIAISTCSILVIDGDAEMGLWLMSLPAALAVWLIYDRSRRLRASRIRRTVDDRL